MNESGDKSMVEIGSVVALKMTVEKVTDEKVSCVWMEGTTLHRKDFSISDLSVVVQVPASSGRVEGAIKVVEKPKTCFMCGKDVEARPMTEPYIGRIWAYQYECCDLRVTISLNGSITSESLVYHP